MKINHLNTYLPIAAKKGSCVDRLNKAEELTKEFNIRLQRAFVFGDVPEKGLNTIFKKLIKHPIPIEIIHDTTKGKAIVTHSVNESEVAEGYTMILPFNSRTNGLDKKNSNVVIRQVMLLFQEMLNPKYFQRINLLFNTGLENVGKTSQFYNEKIYTKKMLSTDELNKFLKGKKTGKKIDILQYFRQSLIKEINVQKFLKKDKEEYHLKPKLEMIEKRLIKEIKFVRNKTKKSVLANNSNV